MNPNQPLPSVPTPGRQINPTMMVAIFFGVGTLLFGGLSIIEYSTAQRATKTLNAQVKAAQQTAYEKGLSDQKEADFKAAESPFRSYAAPAIFGGIDIRFPKNWSGTVAESQSANMQIHLIAHPDFVKTLPNQDDNAYALHFQLIQGTYADQLKRYQDLAKAKKVKLSEGEAGGISKGTRVDGKFDGVHDGILVLVPVRDKTAVFSTDDRKFSNEFTQILAQSHIAP